MEKKYKMTDETKTLFDGTILHRIKATKHFGFVKKGDLGGWIEKEENLSHNDKCWLADNAMVYNNARVYGGAQVRGNVRIRDNAMVYDNATLFGDALIFGDAEIYGNATVSGNALIFGDAHVFENADIRGNAHVYANAKVFGNSHISDKVYVYGNANICGVAHVDGCSCVSTDAYVGGIAHISGNAAVRGGALIRTPSDCVSVGPVGHKDQYITFYRHNDGGILIAYGPFDGMTPDKFKLKIKSIYGDKTKNALNPLYLLQCQNVLEFGMKMFNLPR